MARHQNIYKQKQLTKWLLTITLFFSCFCPIGFNYAAPAKQLSATKTEVAVICPVVKKSIPYKTIRSLSANKYTAPVTRFANFKLVIRQYNQLVRIKTEQYSQQLRSAGIARPLLQTPPIKQSPGKDLPPSARV